MMILRIVLLLLLASCATTEAEKRDREELSQIATDRYEEVEQYCHANSLSVGVDCEAGRACHKYPNNREKLTAYCVKWRTQTKFDHSIESRVLRDMERQTRRRY